MFSLVRRVRNFVWSDICSGKAIVTTISEISVSRRGEKVAHDWIGVFW